MIVIFQTIHLPDASQNSLSVQEDECELNGRLEGKTALITGGSSGIGLATALLFAKEGAKVAIASRSADKGRSAIAKIQSFSHNEEHIYIRADASKPEDAKRMVQAVIRKFKRLDILFCNAGINMIRPVIEMSEADWNNVIRNNLTSSFLTCKYSLPHMIKRRRGSIICNASTNSLVGRPNFGAYGASKGAILIFAKCLALEMAQFNIRVNCVCPSTIETDMVLQGWIESGNPRKMRKARLRLHPIGRLGTPEDVARAVLFLATDESSFITGTQIVVDGGYTAA